MIRVARELDCPSTYIRLRESEKSEDKVEGAQIPKKISVSQNGGGLEECHNAAEEDLPIAKKGTQMRVLVVKGAEEVENAEANSKYHDKVEGQRLRNFIRPISVGCCSSI
ncbi:hypothetical protein BHE74_00010467 [Ensete ventricosum]|nr:hypothetical protein GW17_00018927 [Ensete ventricosum]RWW81155.1 hypothetical protein BHE74_00010467 [Ensete ventricosum]